MGVQEVVNLIVNNGTAIGCLVYFMVYNNRQLTALNKSIQEMTDAINKMNNEKNRSV